jgi:hypothetical protein
MSIALFIDMDEAFIGSSSKIEGQLLKANILLVKLTIK